MNISLLNEKWVQKEIKNFLELSENEYRASQNLWDRMNAALIIKFIGLNNNIKELERFDRSNFRAHLKAIDQKDSPQPKGVDVKK